MATDLHLNVGQKIVSDPELPMRGLSLLERASL